MKRASGILMHITSLPSKWGVGTLGEEAFRFVDFLKRSGQSYWQILPRRANQLRRFSLSVLFYFCGKSVFN